MRLRTGASRSPGRGRRKGWKFSRRARNSLPDPGSRLEATGKKGLETPRNCRDRPRSEDMETCQNLAWRIPSLSASRPPWKSSGKLPALSKHFHPALERNESICFQPISRSKKRLSGSNLVERLGVEAISTRARNGLEDALEISS